MTDIVTFTPNPTIDVSTAVDRVVPVHKLRCTDQRRDPGGGGINVARVVKRLGGDVAAVYPVGGVTGQLLRQMIEADGINSHTCKLSGETREDFSVSETSSGKQFRFVLPGPHLNEQEWYSCLDLLRKLPSAPRFLVASGSLPPGVPEDYYAQVAHIAAAWGAPMVLDTAGAPLAAALKQGLYLIKPNLGELGRFVGRTLDTPDDWENAARDLIATGQVEIVALSLGHFGAALVTEDRVIRAAAIPIKPASTVGAGDSFLGAIVWRLAQGHDLEDALRYGIAAGTAALLHPGTDLCRPDDVARLLPRVQITEA